MTDNMLSRALAILDTHPVLVDIGASGAPPAVWNPIATQSNYIGFDPDLREIKEIQDGQFYKATIINEAVTAEAIDHAGFYLTSSPFCSSTLKPDLKSLSNYVFSDLFIVERQAQVRATTLNAVAQKLNLSSLDWIKVDSQGTDLRLFTTLNADLRSHVLALDVEPGLIDAYIGEDLFIDVHGILTKNGYWLANLDLQGTVRVKQTTLSGILSLPQIDYGTAGKFLKQSPCWCEARYLKTIESLDESGAGEREFVLLWVFSMLDNQLGFALDVALAAVERFPKSSLIALLRDEATERVQASYNNYYKMTQQAIPKPLRLAQRAKRLANRVAHKVGIR